MTSIDTAPRTAGETSEERIRAAAERIRSHGASAPRPARDPVNLPMINNWTEALGDTNPVYRDAAAANESVHGRLVAPPAMAQVWTMGGLHGERAADDPLGAINEVLDEAGFISVLATNCEQTYHRYLAHGEHLTVSAELGEVTGPKQTGLGFGWFVTIHNTWYSGGEPVAEMLFRVLKFRPAEPDGAEQSSVNDRADPQPDTAVSDVDSLIRPAINDDTAYFWEGAAVGELRIQRCGGCGLLRHPPGPMCPECGATKPTHFLACGRGEVYSYVVHHHPRIPGRRAPFVVALVELDEGVRMLGELSGIEPERVHIGLRVGVRFARLDEKVTMPYWTPLAGDHGTGRSAS